MNRNNNLNKSNKAIQRLSGGIAHDLNNIIMVLEGFSGCLRKSPSLNEKQIRYIDQIDKATARAGDLTAVLLSICERSILNMSYFNLHQLIETFIKNKKEDENFIHRMDLKNEAPESSIYFDKSGLMTILENLYENSIYPGEESRYISYKIKEKTIAPIDEKGDLSPGVYIVLDVLDDGPGIKEDLSCEIFEPYFSTKPRGKGKGIGLAVCAGIIQQCGAYIENVHSEQKGFHIRVYFPDKSEKSNKSLSDISSEKSPGTILLIDDDEIIRELLKQALISAGYSIYSTSSPAEGLSIINTFPIDILVTEFLLPDSSAFDLMEKIQKDRRNLKVIFLTGFSKEENDLTWLENFRFLQKPIKPSVLINEIQDMEQKEIM